MRLAMRYGKCDPVLVDEYARPGRIKTSDDLQIAAVGRRSVLTWTRWLHEPAKLRDPAVQGGAEGQINRAIDEVIEYGRWDARTESQLM